MLKICVMTDNPSLPTGMARVGREIATALHRAGHEVCYIGWYENPPAPQNFPFKVIPCQNRFFGSDILDATYKAEQWDILLTIGDMWRLDYIGDYLRCKTRRMFQWLAYAAIDGEALTGGVPKYLHPIYRGPDKVIAYTEYGREAIENSIPDLVGDVGLIYHGVDPNVFYPMTETQRTEIRKKFDCQDKFVFLVVARNQPRKNIPEIFKAWRILTLEGRCPEARLWPHMNFDNDPNGISISQLMETYGFPEMDHKNIMFMHGVAHGKSSIDLPSEHLLNEIYNAADCLIMLASEGFGLPCLEAMACRKPVIALNHSALGELCAYGRGLLVPVAYSITGSWMHERPYPDIAQAASAMEKIYTDKELREEIAEKSYKFSQKHTWANKGQEWADVIQKMEYPLTGEVKLKEVV